MNVRPMNPRSVLFHDAPIEVCGAVECPLPMNPDSIVFPTFEDVSRHTGGAFGDARRRRFLLGERNVPPVRRGRRKI